MNFSPYIFIPILYKYTDLSHYPYHTYLNKECQLDSLFMTEKFPRILVVTVNHFQQAKIDKERDRDNHIDSGVGGWILEVEVDSEGERCPVTR